MWGALCMRVCLCVCTSVHACVSMSVLTIKINKNTQIVRLPTDIISDIILAFI